MWNYDEKFIVHDLIDRRMLIDENFMSHIKESQKRELLLFCLGDKFELDHGVNIKLIRHEYDVDIYVRQVCTLALVSYPKEWVVEVSNIDFSRIDNYICVWCGSKNPLDDKYHSGTCENCGGVKV